jgi:hydroxymethylglutaryl-CoA lyase
VSNSVQLVDVSPRDGLQADPADLSTATKIDLIERLAGAGVHRIEAASFVSPKAVPKMADGESVMAGIERRPGIEYSALALNLRGAERAIAAGADALLGVVPASDTFSQRNQGATIDEAIDRWTEIAAAARAAGIPTEVTISVACGCPFEGRVPTERVADIARRVAATEPDEIGIADTIGVGVPNQVQELFGVVADVAPAATPRGHFHNTRNTALANIAAALDVGVRVFDASLGGVGGCPFAPRATGNVATEDVVYLLHEMGYDTGVDLDALIAASTWLEEQLGHGVPSLVAKAGGFPTGE